MPRFSDGDGSSLIPVQHRVCRLISDVEEPMCATSWGDSSFGATGTAGCQCSLQLDDGPVKYLRTVSGLWKPFVSDICRLRDVCVVWIDLSEADDVVTVVGRKNGRQIVQHPDVYHMSTSALHS